MKIVHKHQLSNSASDAIINFFNKFSNLDTSPLPLLTRIGKELLDNSTIPYMKFKEVLIVTFQNVEYSFYYQSLIKTIKSLIMIDSINQSLVLDYNDKREVINSMYLESNIIVTGRSEKIRNYFLGNDCYQLYSILTQQTLIIWENPLDI